MQNYEHEYEYTYGKKLKSPMGVCREKIQLPNRVETNPEIIKQYNTDVFVNVNGMDLPYYEELWQIPDTLPDQTRLAISRYAVEENGEPVDYHQARLYVRWEEPNGNLITTQEALEKYGENFDKLLAGWITYIIIIAILGGVAIAVLWAWKRFVVAPCGETGKERVIDDCTKLIMAPDCSYRIYNSCTHEWESDWMGGFNIQNIIKWTITLIAIGIAAYVLLRIIPERKPKPAPTPT